MRGLIVTMVAVALGLAAPTGPRAQESSRASARLGTPDHWPQPTERPVPELPEDVGPLSGAMVFEVVVGRDGAVAHARLAQGLDPKADALALDAVRRWHFQPARDSMGRPIATLVGVELAYREAGRASGSRAISTAVRALPRTPLAPAVIPEVYPMSTRGLVDPRLVREVTPMYTAEAMRARIQGQVDLEIVILADGTVGSTRVLKSLDAEHGLDQEAMVAARYWLFQPARMDGKPVASTAKLSLSFRIF